MLTRAAVVVAVVLGLGVGGVTLVGVAGSDSAPTMVARTLGFGSLAQNPFGPAPVDKKQTRPKAAKPKSGKPKANKPGQKARPRSNALPGVGKVCRKAQINRIRTTPRGTMVCANMGSGKHRWVKISGVDPQVRKLGGKCTGQYTTARSSRGKAMQCARGRWTYGA